MREKCPGCDAVAKRVPIQGREVIFWKRAESGLWWRDEGHMPGDRCGFCGVPGTAMLWNGWAQRKRKAKG